MDLVDNDFLAGTRLSGDEQRGIYLGDGLDGVHDMLHFLAVDHEIRTGGILALDEGQLPYVALRHHALVLQTALQVV